LPAQGTRHRALCGGLSEAPPAFVACWPRFHRNFRGRRRRRIPRRIRSLASNRGTGDRVIVILAGRPEVIRGAHGLRGTIWAGRTRFICGAGSPAYAGRRLNHVPRTISVTSRGYGGVSHRMLCPLLSTALNEDERAQCVEKPARRAGRSLVPILAVSCRYRLGNEAIDFYLQAYSLKGGLGKKIEVPLARNAGPHAYVRTGALGFLACPQRRLLLVVAARCKVTVESQFFFFFFFFLFFFLLGGLGL